MLQLFYTAAEVVAHCKCYTLRISRRNVKRNRKQRSAKKRKKKRNASRCCHHSLQIQLLDKQGVILSFRRRLTGPINLVTLFRYAHLVTLLRAVLILLKFIYLVDGMINSPKEKVRGLRRSRLEICCVLQYTCTSLSFPLAFASFSC